MWYIVYKEKFKSGFVSVGETGGGYFVKYKDKLSDTYSDNWFEANRYKSIGSALSRLGVDIGKQVVSWDKFYEYNRISKQSKRDKKLSELLDEEVDQSSLILSCGRIEKIGDNGEFLGSATDDIMKFINDKIKINKSSYDKRMVKYNEFTGVKSGYIIETVEGEDFWDGFKV